MSLQVLYEDNHCLAVNKPAGMPSQADESGAEPLVEIAADEIRHRYRKPGNVYVGLVHRLDRPTSGVVLLARTSKAASRLSAQFHEGTIEKLYWAIVEGSLAADEGTWVDRLVKDRGSNTSRAVEGEGREARVDFRVLGRGGGTTWIELRPATGRSHQLRVQLASRGLPILGDLKYGACKRVKASDGGHRIALHARSLRFTHPTRAEEISIEAPVPADWPGPGRSPRGRPSETSRREEG